MCLLTLIPGDVAVPEQDLRNGHEVNTDGCGLAAVTDDGIIIERSMEPLVDRAVALRAEYPYAPIVYHARLSTGSAATPENLHPFQAGDDDQTWIFHNGALHVGDWAKDMSDTKAFADYIFPAAFAGSLDDAPMVALLEQWMTPLNKMLIVTVNPEYDENIYVLNRDQWLVTPAGVLHSNSDFLGKGDGWDEVVSEDGTLWRWRALQPGQCGSCHLYGCDGTCPPPTHPGHRFPATRNETERRAIVAAAGRVRM
jgi:predicted glutamine amidotransferase